MAEIKFNYDLKPVVYTEPDEATKKRAMEFSGGSHFLWGNHDADVSLMFGDNPNKYTSTYVCTGKVYTYGFGTVFSGPARRDHDALLPVANSHAYDMYASAGHDGIVFAVDNAPHRNGTAELELLACLAPIRHNALAWACMGAVDEVMALVHACIRAGRIDGMPFYGVNGYMYRDGNTNKLSSAAGFLVYHVSRLLVPKQPDVRWNAYSMPYAGAVCAETLVRMYSRDALFAALVAAHKYLEENRSDDSIIKCRNKIAEALLSSSAPWNPEYRYLDISSPGAYAIPATEVHAA